MAKMSYIVKGWNGEFDYVNESPELINAVGFTAECTYGSQNKPLTLDGTTAIVSSEDSTSVIIFTPTTGYELVAISVNEGSYWVKENGVLPTSHTVRIKSTIPFNATYKFAVQVKASTTPTTHDKSFKVVGFDGTFNPVTESATESVGIGFKAVANYGFGGITTPLTLNDTTTFTTTVDSYTDITVTALAGYNIKAIAVMDHGATTFIGNTGELSHVVRTNPTPGNQFVTLYVHTVTVTPDPEPEPGGDYKLTNNYALSPTQFRNLQQYSLSFGINQSTSYSMFINQVHLIPVKLNPSYVVNTEGIIIGDKRSSAEGYVLKSNQFTIPLGSINVEATYGNSLDYHKVSTELVIPFKDGAISLEPSLVVGKTITITMLVDMYGNATVNVVDGSGLLIASDGFKLGYDVPLYKLDDRVNVKPESVNVMNGIRTAFVRMSRPLYYDNGSNLMTQKNGKLVSLRGYVEVEHIDIQSAATLSEKQRIESILQSGVYIK